MADKLTPERRSWNMSRIRGKNTKPELLVRRLLHAKGYRYRLHGKAGATRLPGNPDLVFAGRRKTGILTFRDDPLIVAVEVPWEAIRRKGARFSMRDRVT